MINKKMREVYFYLGCNEIQYILLINVDVIWRTCWFPVVDTSQNDSSPDSEIVFQIFDFVGGLSRSKNLLRNFAQIRSFFYHVNALYSGSIMPNECCDEILSDDYFLPYYKRDNLLI